MNRKEVVLVFLFSFVITAVFFYKVFLHGLIAFPGDLLLSEYVPWKLVSFFGYNPGAYPSKAQFFDVLRQLYPWRHFAMDSLRSGTLPLWNPYNFSGAPLLANFQSAVFYPLNIVYAFLAAPIAWNVLVFLQPFLMCFFMYLYCRRIGMRPMGATLGALSYAFSYFSIVWLEYNTVDHILMWLPLTLLAIEHLFERRQAVWAGILVFCGVASLFAGHPQVFLYAYTFSIVYALFRKWQQKNILSVNLIYILVLQVIVLGIGAIQLIPGIELLQNAARSVHDSTTFFEKILIQPWQLVMLVVPDFFGNPATRNYWLADTYVGKVTYIGIVPILFFFLSFGRVKASLYRFFLIASCFLLVVTTNNPISFLLYHLPLPLVTTSAPTLSLFLFAFSFSIVCGYSVDAWIDNKKTIGDLQKRLLIPLGLFLILWATLLVLPRIVSLDWQHFISVSIRNLAYTSVVSTLCVGLVLLMTVQKRFLSLFIVCLLLIQVGDTWRGFAKFVPFAPLGSVFPSTQVLTSLQKKGIDRLWGYGGAAIEANIATEYRLYSTDGYDPLYPRRYGEFIQSSQKGNIITTFTDRTRSDARIAPGYGEDDLQSNMYRSRVLDSMGVKYVLDTISNGSTEKTFPNPRFSPILDENGIKVFENRTVLPRFFLTSSYDTFVSPQEFEKKFFATTRQDKTILLEQKIPISLDALQTTDQVTNTTYTPSRVTFLIHTQGNTLLFLSDTFYPGWKAFVDGNSVPIYRANYTFRAVALPKGARTVVFSYEPSSVHWGLIITGVSSVLFLFLLFFDRILFSYNRKR